LGNKGLYIFVTIKRNTMIQIIRTNSNNKDFIELVKKLDAFLTIIDGDDHSFYSQFNKIDATPVGCGAIKKNDAVSMEIKRIYVIPESRGKEIASKILSALENWAKELSFTKCILETGKQQQEAIKLYKKNGYKLISNYGQYANVENSVCFEKELK